MPSTEPLESMNLDMSTASSRLNVREWMGERGVKLFMSTDSEEKALLERALLGGSNALMLSSEDWLLMSLGPSGVSGSWDFLLLPLIMELL